MAYQNGTATGPNDMLTKIRDFAVAQGWTTNRDVVAGSGRELSLSKGTSFFSFRSYENENVTMNGVGAANRYGIALNGHDSYSAGDVWDRQPGFPVRQSLSGGSQAHANLPMPINFGPFPNYYLFTPNANCIYLELEVASSIFQRLGFGKLDTFNSGVSGDGRFFYATGGNHPSTSVSSSSWLGQDDEDASFSLEEVPFRCAAYTTASSTLQGSYLRAAFDAFDNWCGSARNNTTGANQVFNACQGGGCHDKVLREFSNNPRNGVGILLPNIVSINRGLSALMPVGTVPGMRYMDMALYTPAQEFVLGPDTWKVFPWYQKGGRSATRAIAYKKIV